LKHPDEKVRENLTKAVDRLGYQWPDDQIGEIPAIRTDLEATSMPPLTAKQRLKAKTEPLEKEATKKLKMGPSEDAVKLYEQLLELRPAYEPYEQAIEKARAYMEAAASSTEHWYPDAPYIGLKGRYSYYMASSPTGTVELKEKYELPQYLNGEGHHGWTSSPFSKDPKHRDKYVKAYKLYEHIIKNYPANEYKVLAAKSQLGGLTLNMKNDRKGFVLTWLDVITVPTSEVTDSTDNRRNKPVKTAGGLTQTQINFEKYFKHGLRERIIELSEKGETADYLLTQIITRCKNTDPKIVEMAEAALIRVHTSKVCPGKH
jgi:tetratricopeptide (TPR) repeat protein